MALIKYQVEVKPRALKALKKLDVVDQKRIYAALLLLSENPFPPLVKKLNSRPGFRITVGKLRIIYEVDGKRLIITVIDLGPRREVYRK